MSFLWKSFDFIGGFQDLENDPFGRLHSSMTNLQTHDSSKENSSVPKLKDSRYFWLNPSGSMQHGETQECRHDSDFDLLCRGLDCFLEGSLGVTPEVEVEAKPEVKAKDLSGDRFIPRLPQIDDWRFNMEVVPMSKLFPSPADAELEKSENSRYMMSQELTFPPLAKEGLFERNEYIPPPPPPPQTNESRVVEDDAPDEKVRSLLNFDDMDLLKKLVKEHPFSEEIYGKNLLLKKVPRPPPPKEEVIWGIRTLRGGVDFVDYLPPIMSGKPYKYEIRIRTTCLDVYVDIDNERVEMTIDNFDRFRFNSVYYEFRFVCQFTSNVGPKDSRNFVFEVYNSKTDELIGISQEVEIRSKRTKGEYKFWRQVLKQKRSNRKSGKKRKRKSYYEDEDEEEEEEEEEYSPRKKRKL